MHTKMPGHMVGVILPSPMVGVILPKVVLRAAGGVIRPMGSGGVILSTSICGGFGLPNSGYQALFHEVVS